MPSLPKQAVYLPFETGPYRMAMALTTVPESDWFEFDERYADEMAEKRQLLRERHRDVFAALPVSDAARAGNIARDRRQSDNLCAALVRA